VLWLLFFWIGWLGQHPLPFVQIHQHGRIGQRGNERSDPCELCLGADDDRGSRAFDYRGQFSGGQAVIQKNQNAAGAGHAVVRLDPARVVLPDNPNSVARRGTTRNGGGHGLRPGAKLTERHQAALEVERRELGIRRRHLVDRFVEEVAHVYWRQSTVMAWVFMAAAMTMSCLHTVSRLLLPRLESFSPGMLFFH
jgi:hypothetical protein